MDSEILVSTARIGMNETGEVSVNNQHSSQLRALLSIRRFSAGLEEHRDQLKQIENDLSELNKSTLALLGAGSNMDARAKWDAVIGEINDEVLSINQLLSSANKKVEQRDRSDSSELWKQIDGQMELLKASCKKMEDLGFELLSESDQIHWKTNILNFRRSILPLFISHAMAYKVELQMIEQYTPEELNKITQVILNKIPGDFTVEEAKTYERDYLKAMDDLEKEFHEEKNLWDTFLDILAGGTHQTPSERVMLNRWIEGEKGEL